jgi:hypothetical protein
MFTKAVKAYPNITLSFYQKKFKKLEHDIEKMKAGKRFDVVIAWGKYAQEDSCICGIPTVGLKLTFSDILYAFKSIEGFSRKCALVCHDLTGKEQLKEYAAAISEVMRLPVHICDTDKSDDIIDLLKQLKAHEYSAILGGAETTEAAAAWA